MSDCIFCKIVSGEFGSATIYENDEFKVILDRFPANEGHVLILVKEHPVILPQGYPTRNLPEG